MEKYIGKSEKKGIPPKVLAFFSKTFHSDEPVPFEFSPELPKIPVKWKAPQIICLLAVPTLHCVESLTKEPLTRYKENTTTESKFHISLQVF